MPMKNPTLDMLMRGVNTTESSNNYKAIGPRTRTGDRAYGISQVMGDNVPDWTKQFYGQSLTPEQYLNTPDAQVAVTQGKLGELLQQYKTPQDAASVWFSGRPLDKSANASDGFLKTPEYIQRVMQAGGMPGSFNDARSFQATGTDEMANAVNQPPGAQSISLGDQENTQPFNNIGSTLANMGASIASLDNRGTGIAALNASRVAGNLAAQEQAREAQGGWKYAGQTQNGQGLMFQNSRGEIRVEPLSSQFAGQREPESLRFLDALAVDPQRMAAYQQMHNTGSTPSDPESLKLAGMDWLNNGNPQALKDVPIKQRPEAMKLAREQYKTDTGQDFDPADLALRRGDYKVLQSESAKFGQMLAPTQAAHDRLQADIKIAKEQITNLPSDLNSSNLPFNKFMQMTAEQLQTAGYSNKLSKARESIYNVERGYTNVQSNGMRTGDTVAAQKRAEGLINSAMTPDTLLGEIGKDGNRSGGLLDFMSDSGTRILNSVKGGQDTLRQEWKSRARNFGSGVQKTEDDILNEIDKKAKTTSSPSNTKLPSDIKTPNDLMSWAKQQGLKKGDPLPLPDGTMGVMP